MIFKGFKIIGVFMKGDGVMKKLGALLLLMSCVGLLGCAKEKGYEFKASKRVESKTKFSKTDYGSLKKDEIAKLSPEEKRKYQVPRIAVLSYGQTSRSATASMPYYQGRTKLVEFEMTEHELEVRELEKDPRYADNPTNNKIIMTIPLRHVEYECELDAYGECQNKEVETEKKHWSQRPYIEMNLGQAKIKDTDELPVEMTNLFGGCYTEDPALKVIDIELDRNVFNLEVQKSLKINVGNPGCFEQLGDIDGIDDLFAKLSIDVRYVYSIVREDQIASKDYKKVKYANDDEGAFGYFNTKLSKLDVDNNAIENNDEVLMNRWNPAKKVITYYLSDSFAKPEYDYILSATQTAINNINSGLNQADAGIQIQLLPPSGKKVGDIRNNMIVLVDDPLAARVIGYGPSAAHPLTGEILNARTVMYLGTIKTIVKRTYEEIREEIAKSKGVTSVKGVNSLIDDIKTKAADALRAKSATKVVATENDAIQASIDEISAALEPETLAAKVAESKAHAHSASANASLAQIKAEILSFKKMDKPSPLAKSSKFINKRIEVLSKNNVYPEELFNAGFAFKAAGVDEKIAEDLKPWVDLTAEEKDAIVRQVLPHIWIPTLVHEFGHNLGLRHNFAGSEDKANFYSQEELQKMGVQSEVPYSSVMDYSYRTMNELPTMGKYDIAALKFGYARQVEAVNEKGEVVGIVTVKDTIADAAQTAAANGATLKEYRYCTDEHASANPTCNRFDEGTNLLEIATHFVTSYEDNYKKVNKRNSRKNFSTMQEGNYLSRLMSGFYDLRLMLELYERIKFDFGVEEGNELWTTNPFLKELYEASKLGGEFFLNILITPDVHCAIATAEAPTTPVAMVPITNLSANATSCFHPEITEVLGRIGQANGGLNLIAAGEGGKSFRSKKDPLNQNAYADQIDVQGIWVDKMLALNLLFARELGSSLFDKYNQSYLNHGAVAPAIELYLTAILMGDRAAPVPFRDADGKAVQFDLGEGQVSNTLPVALEFGQDHNILVPDLQGLSEYFGLPAEQTTFAKALIGTLAKLVPASVGGVEAQKFLDTFVVYKLERPASSSIKDRYFANSANKIAKKAIDSATAVEFGPLVDKKQIEALIKAIKAKKKVSSKASDAIKALAEVDVKVLEAFLKDELKSIAYYEELLETLIKRY